MTLKISAKRADAVVVSSALEYEDAVEFGISRKKLHIIPMGIDLPDPAPAKNRIEGAPLNILFVGRIARVRRVELLLRAVAGLSFPCRLTLVGGEEKTSSLSKPGYLRELQRLCASLGIDDRVHFAGAKPPEALPAYYQTADVFAYPSLYENFAQPILEAAAHGLPVVSTPVGIAREIIRDGETGFLVPGDPVQLREKLERLNDPTLREGMGGKIREIVRKKFAWKRIMDQYMELYRSF